MRSKDIAMLVYAAALIPTFFLSLPTFVVLASPGAVYVSFKVIGLFKRVHSMVKAGLLLLKLVSIAALYVLPVFYFNSQVLLTLYWIGISFALFRYRRFVT